MNFDILNQEIERGMQGKNVSIPTGFDRLSNYAGIRRRMYFLLGGYTGCLSGDTVLSIGRGEAHYGGRPYTLKELYYKFNNMLVPRNKGDKRNGNKWDLSADSTTISYKYDTKFIGRNRIINVIESGIQETFILKTESGKSIRATKNHQFLISESYIFKSLQDLRSGDFVYIQSTSQSKGRNPRPYRYEIITKMPYYLSAINKKVRVNGILYIHQRVKKTRAVYDSFLNNVSLDEFIYQVKSNPNHGYIFSDLKMDIHHKDGNPNNDDIENLLLLSKKEHNSLHSKITGNSHFGNRTIIKDRIISIDRFGEEMTYDIEMQLPYNNFMANGIFVHNSGKTSLVDDAFVLNPYEWYVNSDKSIKLTIIYRSMERSRVYKLAKWMARKVFMEQGIIIPLKKLLSWSKADKLTHDEHDLVLLYKDYMNEMDDVITIIDGPENPVGIAKELRAHALSRGKIEDIDQFNKVYIPDDPDEVTLVVLDTINLLKLTKELSSKKSAIDKMSDELRYARDFFGYTPVVVSQFNRDIASPIRLKKEDVEPNLEDFKESGQTQDDADVVMALFDPVRYKVSDTSGYDLNKLVDADGNNYFRSLRILKNSYGVDNLRIGLAFLGDIGKFKELPRQRQITDDHYDDVRNRSYFLRNG